MCGGCCGIEQRRSERAAPIRLGDELAVGPPSRRRSRRRSRRCPPASAAPGRPLSCRTPWALEVLGLATSSRSRMFSASVSQSSPVRSTGRAASSRSTSASTFAATRPWKPSLPGWGRTSSVRNSRTAASNSRAVGRPYPVAASAGRLRHGRLQCGPHGLRRQQFQQIPLLLGGAPTHCCQLDGAHLPSQMHVGLGHAADAPGQRSLHEPPVKGLPVDRPPARAFVRARPARRSCRGRRLPAAPRISRPAGTTRPDPRADRRDGPAPSR